MEQHRPFHLQLKLERERRGWSQADLAKYVGKISVKTIRRWENGQSRPQPFYRQTFINLFGKSLEELGLVVQPDPADEMEDPPHKEDWGEAPRGHPFYGRGEEQAQLQNWMTQQHSRIIAVIGIGGIGKTALAAKAVVHVKDAFTAVFWRSLHNAPPLDLFLQQCLQFLFLQPQPLPTSSDDLLILLHHHLQNQRCLLVLDNFESLLQPGQSVGQYRDGYEPYGRLLRLLGETEHQSCLLLTSREKPREMASLEGKHSPVRSLRLEGVGEREGKEILQEKDLFGSEENWTELVRLYSGNPLALKLVAVSIQEVFAGAIETFLKDEEIVFGDINRLVDQQFHRLSTLEQEVLYWLAIEREAVPLEEIREDLTRPASKGIFVEVIASLLRRSLI